MHLELVPTTADHRLMSSEVSAHISTEALDAYLLRRGDQVFLDDPESESIEEHLLVCHECLDKVEILEKQILILKSSLALHEQEQTQASGDETAKIKL